MCVAHLAPEPRVSFLRIRALKRLSLTPPLLHPIINFTNLCAPDSMFSIPWWGGETHSRLACRITCVNDF